MCAVIIVSCAALLGTSPETDEPAVTHTFERKGVDGGFVELTADSPRATFFVTLTANDLGPDSVPSTNSALANLDCNLTSSGLADGATAPFVTVTLSSPDNTAVSEKQVLDHLTESQPLPFFGNCSKPTEGTACRARFQVDLWRIDDGASGGTVRFDWLFDVSSSGSVQGVAKADSNKNDPLDPPWTISVSQP